MDDLEIKTVGQVLKAAREAKGASIADVAAEIMVPQHYLQAIENDDYHALPGQTYAIGFVRNYSKYLCLPSTDIVDQLRDQVNFPKALNTGEIVSGFVDPPRQNVLPSGASIAAGLCVAVGVYGLWFAASSAQTSAALPAALPEVAMMPSPAEKAIIREQVAELAPALQKSEIAEDQEKIAQIDEDVDVPPQPAEDKMVAEAVNIHVAEESWVEIRTGGKVYFSGIKKPGDVLSVPADKAATAQLTTGNAGGIWLSVGAWTSQNLGETGRVRRNLALAPQQLFSMLSSADRT